LAHLAKIFAHVTPRQATAAGWGSPVEDGLSDFLALTTVEGLWGQGEIALWGRLSVADGEPILRSDKPQRRLGGSERVYKGTGSNPSLVKENDVWSIEDGAWRWVDVRLSRRSCRTAEEEAREELRRIGEHRKAISDEAILKYAKDHPKLGRPRIYKELRDAGYGVTKQRVQNAIDNRDASKERLKGGRPSQRDRRA